MSSSNVSKTTNNLRTVGRAAIRANIADTAMTLFIEQGFEQTTVEQIANRAGVSARSVFRYFESKEDMVVGNMYEIGETLREALEARPEDQEPWEALRQSFHTLLATYADNQPEALSRAHLLDSTPSLQSARRQKQAQWLELLIPGVQARLPGPINTRQLRAAAITASALACLDIAIRTWAESGGTTDIVALLDTALAAVRTPVARPRARMANRPS
ncbi:TetR family transcriptional regulator [Nocardia sp. NPDC047038]|uniref:TetR/AcrR family transcriptional regulator n=1 Tax=Nocardia sp. NPDC047038 TaxID=3154338 RepID=UPI0033F3CD5F